MTLWQKRLITVFMEWKMRERSLLLDLVDKWEFKNCVVKLLVSMMNG